MMDETARRGASVPVWIAIALIVGSALLGGGAAYVVYGTQPTQPAAPSTITAISTTTQTSLVSRLGNGSGSSIDAVAIYRQVNQSIVTVDGFVSSTTVTFFGRSETQISEVLGTGIVVSNQGSDYIVTNFHVVNGASNITVTFWDGNSYPATVKGTDPYSDLAVLTVSNVPQTEYHVISIGSSSSLIIGQPVVAIGNPFGLSSSITVGIVSQLGRTITEPEAGNFSIAGVIQFSAPINPGNSGGPLLDASGSVVGLTAAVVNGSQGVGFAIPSDAITREIGSLIATGGYNQHPYLGISGLDMNYQLAQAEGSPVTYGVLVASVVQGGPAAKAGLQGGTKQETIEGSQYPIGGDIIVSVNGTKILTYDGMVSYLEAHFVSGNTVQLGIIRNGASMSISVVVGVRPPPPPAAS